MSSEDDVGCISKVKEILRELNSKLGNFAEVRQEVQDFPEEVVREKYEPLDF